MIVPVVQVIRARFTLAHFRGNQMLKFQVQSRGPNGRWANVKYSCNFSSLQEAITRITVSDEDGFFSPSMRVISDGRCVYDFHDWQISRDAS